jgi:NADH-ubiquinone oxidoreductase chain 5
VQVPLIHALVGEQDIRKMGGLARLLPFTFTAMLTGSLSLAGFPFLTGFYSKDFILLSAFIQYTFVGRVAFILGVVTAFLTAFYSFRLLYYVFFSTPRFSENTQEKIHESSFLICLPLFFLSICSIFFGYILKDSFVNIGTDFWQNSLYIRYNITISITLSFYFSNKVYTYSRFCKCITSCISLF